MSGDPREPPARESYPRPPALGAAVIYALFAALWILFSDLALESWLGEPRLLVLASTLKGWLFVLVTALLLYGILRRFERRTAESAPSPRDAGRRPYPWLPFAGLALAITAITAGIVIQIVRHEHQQRAEQLQTVADLKAQQLGTWIGERMADVRQLHLGKLLGQTYLRWRRQGDPEALATVTERLAQFVELTDFGHGTLLDEAGRTLWRSAPEAHDLEPAARGRLLAQAPTEGVGWLGPYRDPAGHSHLEFFAVLAAPEGEAPIVVLHADDDRLLPAGLNAWPLPTETGEVVLFRREGDEIVFLSALRFSPAPALSLRRSMGEEALLARQLAGAARGEGELLEGHDYRGVAVIGMGRRVPGTDWYLLAKMDRDEFYANALRDSLWVALAGCFALFAAGTTLYLARQRQELAVARAVQQAQAERLTALRLLGAIADASADAIFAKDREGRYLLFNRAAGGFTGKSPEEVLGRDDTALFPPEQAAMIRANDRRVMDENRVVGYEEALDTALGPRTFLALKGPLRGDDGQVIGVYGISRDITERSAAEEDLRRSNEELQRFNRAMVGRELEMIRLKREINALARALGRPAPYEVPAPEPDGPGRPEASNPLPGGRP